MNLLKPDFLLYLWQIVMFLFFGLILVTLIKFLIVLFKADRAIDELRAYMKRRS